MTGITELASKEDVYVLGRGKEEIKRLNTQHKGLVQHCGGLIQSSIPTENIRTVADIATGTGIWLLDTAYEQNNPENQYVGFDISDIQFPPSTAESPNVKFIQHDMTLPFPEQFHSMFDLVNVRLVLQGVRECDIPAVVENIHQILRPGGYIQWLDINWSTVEILPSSHKALEVITDAVSDQMRYGGLSFHLPQTVEASMRQQGFQNTTVRHISLPRAVRVSFFNDVQRALVTASLRMQMTVEGKEVDWEYINGRVTQILADRDAALASGYYWEMLLAVMVGQKN